MTVRASHAGPSATQPVRHDYLHRVTFTQALMQRVCMLENDAKELYKQLMQSQSDAGYLVFVSAIDKEISFCNLRLGRLLFPLDGEWYIAVVNRVPDEVAKATGSPLSRAQVHFLKTMLERLAMDTEAEDGVCSIGSMDAMNMNTTSQPTQATQAPESSQLGSQKLKLTFQEKEDLLARLVNERWLAKHPQRRGHYSIGVRSFLELKEWLLSLALPEDTRAAWEKFL